MAIGYSSVEDVCNAALREAGYTRPIGEIFEGSRASRVALEVYGPARDGLLMSQEWDFALRDVGLSAAVGGVLAFGFTHVYTWPPDALRLRYVRGFIPSPNNDPQPVRWQIGNDAALAIKVIWTNVPNAYGVYIAQISDMTQWNAAFTRTLVALLARIFAFALKDDINLSMARAKLAEQAKIEAADVGDGGSPLVEQLMERGARVAAAAQ